jgi:hypothetical protein
MMTIVVSGHHPVHIDDIFVAQSSDTIRMYYLEAPVFHDIFGDLLETFDLYHCGIGLLNTRTGKNITIEYSGTPPILDAVLPILSDDPTEPRIRWRNNGAMSQYDCIDTVYWSSTNAHLGDMTGDQFNNFITFIRTVNSTHKFYDLFGIYMVNGTGRDWPDDYTKRHMIRASYTCYDFVWDMIHEMSGMGVQFRDIKIPRLYINVYTNDYPKRIEDGDPEHEDEIIRSFGLFRMKLGRESLLRMIRTLYQSLSGRMYIRYHPYYLLTKARRVDTRYVMTPLHIFPK